MIYDKWFIQSRYNTKLRRNYVRKDWITVGLAKSCGTKNALYNIWRKTRTHHNWTQYTQYKKKLDCLITKAKYDFYKQEFASCKTDLKKTWKTINTVLGRKKRNKILVFNSCDAAHNFNKYFTSVANNLIAKNCSSKSTNFVKYLGPKNPCNIEGSKFVSTDLDALISKLNNNKSTYFSPIVIKKISTELSPVLTNIFNFCYESGTFPDELKAAKVVPIFKNRGKIDEISNYRPISMLSVFSKLFEKLIHKRLLDFFNDNNIINPCQYGFRPGHSTQHALINATDNIYKSLDCKLHTLGIFLKPLIRYHMTYYCIN